MKSQIEQIELAFKDAKNANRFGADDDELLQERISSRIIYYFINNVLIQSTANIDNYLSADGASIFERDGCRVSKILIDFSVEGKKTM
uniref:hypothetical protein n=1 Tax=Clostridium sp. NkU-1 TaxID=1095009 RepID=UPI003260C8E1